MARPKPGSVRERLHEIIFEADTPLGKAFDVGLLVAILLSILAVTLESVRSFAEQFGTELRILEWIFTVLFTVEYLVRIYTIGQPLRYMRSFFGLVDLLSILPTYLSFFIAGSQSLLAIRAIRLLRVFRVLKLAKYLGEANVLLAALRASRMKITVFLGSVLIIVIVMSSLMYLIEGEEHGFVSIPASMYWTIVTMTTVGYGDISPQTPLGRVVASMLMIVGYGIIAVPTGIVTAEISQHARRRITTQACLECAAEGHDDDAKHCKYCGTAL